MSIGGALPFLRTHSGDRKRLPHLILLTLAGSLLGAVLLLHVPTHIVPLIVSSAMIGIAIFSVFYRKSGVQTITEVPSRNAEIAGYILTFLLGIYGGFFSGGYVTILTAIFVATFKMSFIEAIATTKIINVFSSAIATGVFMQQRIIDYRLGIVLGVTMFLGALFGARFAVRIGNLWLKRIFLAAVWILGLKALLFDILGRHLHAASPAHAPE